MGLLTRLRTRLGLPTEYRRKDFEKRERFRDDYRSLARMLMDAVDADSVLDVGCANGFLIEELQAAGKRVGGIEVSPAVRDVLPPSIRDRVRIGDFERAAEDGRAWDLVTCIEVAEHIAPERSEDLVAALAGAARTSIYFTAAGPGQGGHGHINCRPRADWIELFARHGWQEDAERSERLIASLRRLDQLPWLAGNSMLLSSGIHPDPPV